MPAQYIIVNRRSDNRTYFCTRTEDLISASSRTKMPFTEPNARASKQPYARGGCCGRGRYSAWVTTGYPRGSCRENSRTRGNVDRGGRRKSGRTAWQMIFGYLASRGTGKPPHSTLGHGTTPYKKGVVGLWPRGWGKKRMRPINGRRSETRKRRTRLRLHLVWL